MTQHLPDFHIPHAEKIEWMIETAGWALEPVAAQVDVDPPVPPYAYTIGFGAAFGFPDIVVFGLTPVAIRGLIDLSPTCCGVAPRSPSGSSWSVCSTTICAACSHG